MMIITAGGHSTIEWWFTCPPRASTMVWSRRKTLTTYLSTWAPSQWGHWSKQCFCKYIHLCMGMCHQKLQTGLDIHEGLTAQKYFDEMVRPHVKPHVDNHALAGSTVFIRIGAKTFLPVRPISCCQPRIQIFESLPTYGRLCPET